MVPENCILTVFFVLQTHHLGLPIFVFQMSSPFYMWIHGYPTQLPRRNGTFSEPQKSVNWGEIGGGNVPPFFSHPLLNSLTSTYYLSHGEVSVQIPLSLTGWLIPPVAHEAAFSHWATIAYVNRPPLSNTQRHSSHVAVWVWCRITHDTSVWPTCLHPPWCWFKPGLQTGRLEIDAILEAEGKR